MSKDDYFVIVYQILSYLYVQLKKGADIEPKMIEYDGPLFSINKKYWKYIIINMKQDSLITGINIDHIDNYGEHITNLECCQITPKGIAYLSENSFIQRAKELFKDIKDVTPFI